MKIEGLTVKLTCEAEPIQYEGILDGFPTVFRARHGKWQFGVALNPAARSEARIVFVADAEPVFADCVKQFRASRVAA